MRLLTILCLVLLSSCSQPDGPYETFYENGQLRERGNFIDGEPNGLRVFFDEDGNLTGTQTWRNGVVVDSNLNP